MGKLISLKQQRTKRDLWVMIFKAMVDFYRTERPDDKRPDLDILKALMEEFVEIGVVGKNKNGKYVLPELPISKLQ